MEPMDILELIKTRRSIRKFQKTSVEKEKIDKCLEAARWAPSASNKQPWEFLLVSNEGKRKELAKLAKFGKFVGEAPLVFVPLTNPEIHETYHASDTAMATLQFMLAAHAQGLATGWSAVYGKEFAKDIKNVLNIPEHLNVLALIAVGYSALDKDPISLRKPIDKLVHYEKY